MKIMTIVGARPQFVKAAVLSRHLAQDSSIQEMIVHTGQHYDANMSDLFFEEMNIPKPHFNLGIGGKSHGAMTGEMIIKLEELMISEKPDIITIYGDTNSTLAGAIAASKLHIPIAHVEAGLRSFNMKMPEEINRILTDQVSEWLLCPTETAVHHLQKSGVDKSKIHLVGDVMYDAATYYKERSKPSDSTHALIEKLGSSNFFLCTIHRGENTDIEKRLTNIFKALNTIAADTPVILPLHPRTKKFLKQYQIESPNITFIDPVGYFDMIALLNNCKGVLSDSGGLQKEAFFFNKPCLTLRDETEWIELVEHGVNKIVGADHDEILKQAFNFLCQKLPPTPSLYGNADAGEKIYQLLAAHK